MMLMQISPLGQLGLWAPSSGAQNADIHVNRVISHNSHVTEESGHPRYGLITIVLYSLSPTPDPPQALIINP